MTLGIHNSFPNSTFSWGLGDHILTGDTRFVHSGTTGATTTSEGTPRDPISTLEGATNLSQANDNIVILPGHSETITGVGGITNDVAGLTIIGLGVGTRRPRFLMDGAATVTWAISAADVSIENVVLAAGHADIVRAFNITAAGFHAKNIEFVENTAGENFLIPFDMTSAVANACDGAIIEGCRSLGLDAAATEFIALVEDINRLTVMNNLIVQSGSTDGALIKQATGKDMTLLDCRWNFVQHAMTAGDLLIDNDTTANTGIVAHNRCRHADVTGAHSLIDCDGVGLFDNLSVSTNILSGVLVPAADVNL